jgi:hypothetical protein
MDRILGIILSLFLMSSLSGCMAPLMQAVERNDLVEVKGLLDKGADIQASSKSCRWHTDVGIFSYECSALMHASELGKNEIIRVLLDKGADINTEIGGYTALRFAAENGHLETVKLLLDRGAKNPSGALPFAVYGGHAGIVKFLIDNGADVNVRARNHTNWPILAEAAIMGHANVVKLLIEKGADVDAAATIFERYPNDAKFKASLNLLEKYSKQQATAGTPVKAEPTGVKSAAPAIPPTPPLVAGKELPKVAVWDLTSGDIKAAYAQDLTSILVSEVSKLGKYEVYSQENVRTLAGWTAERMTMGCTDTKCLTALGQMDIEKLISGRVGKIGNRYSVSLNLFDTQKTRAEKSISEFGRSEDELIDLVQVAVRKLLGVEAVRP